MKLGKGFKELYKESRRDSDAFQKDLFKYQNQLCRVKTKDEALKLLNAMSGVEICLNLHRERMRQMVEAAENTFAKDFPDIYEE